MKEYWQEQVTISKKVEDLTVIGAKEEIKKIVTFSDAYTAEDLLFALESIIAALKSVNHTVKFDVAQVKKAEEKEQKTE